MIALVYVLAYVAFFACIGFILMKVYGYLKKPVHLRWELYPVAHETHGRAAYGGSYFEDSGWWEKPQKGSLLGAIGGFLQEAVFLHATFKHNKSLWLRTYPFHIGLYLICGSLALTILGALLFNFGLKAGMISSLIGNLTMLCNIIGFAAILVGSLGLIQRRMTTTDLRKFSTPEHFFNLGLFAVYATFGLFLSLTTPMYGSLSLPFFSHLLSFNFSGLPDSWLYILYLLMSFFIMVYVPASFMAHAFMKYFTWHDIRWGDQPTQDNPKTQEKMGAALGFPVSWKAPHIKGDGKKNWGEVATTNPTAQPDA